MSLDDIIKRNQRHAKGYGRHPVANMIVNELTDPTADSTDIKNRILAIAIVGGLLVGIVVLVALFA